MKHNWRLRKKFEGVGNDLTWWKEGCGAILMAAAATYIFFFLCRIGSQPPGGVGSCVGPGGWKSFLLQAYPTNQGYQPLPIPCHSCLGWGKQNQVPGRRFVRTSRGEWYFLLFYRSRSREVTQLTCRWVSLHLNTGLPIPGPRPLTNLINCCLCPEDISSYPSLTNPIAQET